MKDVSLYKSYFTLIFPSFCRNKIPQDKIGNDPLDMQQYNKIFGTCRIPRPQRDQITYNNNSKHIIVMHNNHVSILRFVFEKEKCKFSFFFNHKLKICSLNCLCFLLNNKIKYQFEYHLYKLLQQWGELFELKRREVETNENEFTWEGFQNKLCRICFNYLPLLSVIEKLSSSIHLRNSIKLISVRTTRRIYFRMVEVSIIEQLQRMRER